MSFEEQLKELKIRIDKRLELFFSMVKARDDFISFSYKNIKDYLSSGGKRLRPAALIMAYNGFGGDEEEIYDAALSVEFLHNSTLIHDDIMDEDESRRNKDSIHKFMRDYFLKSSKEINYNGPLFNKASSRFAVSNAICNGNLLYSLGELFLLNSHFDTDLVSRALKVYSNAYRIVNQGQLMDIFFELRDASERNYLKMIEQKTGNLFKACTEIGAVLAGANNEQTEILAKYAINIAVAFQLQDDIMDISPEMKKGHELGSDIKKGKKTLLVIKALEKASKSQRGILMSAIGNESATEDEIKKTIGIIKSSGAVDYVMMLAHKKIVEAKGHLRKTSLNDKSMKFFDGFADFMMERRV